MNVDLMIEHAHVLCIQVMHALLRIMSWIDACMLLLYSYSTMSYRLLLLDLPSRVRRILPLVYCCTVRAVVRSNTYCESLLPVVEVPACLVYAPPPTRVAAPAD